MTDTAAGIAIVIIVAVTLIAGAIDLLLPERLDPGVYMPAPGYEGR